MKYKHPEFRYMIVGLVSFVCTAVLVIIQSSNIDSELRLAIDILAPVLFVMSLLIPVMAKAFAYSEMFSLFAPKNFSPQYAVNQYGLHGRIKGKYTFLDAVSKACAGNFEEAYLLYTRCLSKAEDKRLRAACYKDMAKNLRRMNNNILLLPYMLEACNEFPDEIMFFDWVADYYLWFDKADEGEGHQWYRAVINSKTDDRIKAKAYYYLGIFDLYHNNYSEAEENFENSYRLYSPPPCYLCIDIAVCKAASGKYDEAREYAVQAAAITDSDDDIDYITEKMNYLFKAKNGEINPETEKLVNELKRRREYRSVNSVKTEHLQRINDSLMSK